MTSEQKDLPICDTHIMCDLETLSTRNNARILAIGAVKFDAKKGVYDKFYQAVYTPPLEKLRTFSDEGGFHVSNSTLDWWEKQTPQARAVFEDPNAVTIDCALLSFALWVADSSQKKTVFMWGNGAAFDNAILSTAYALCGMDQPWEYWNDRCYRTIKCMFPVVPFIRVGTHHNALDDAETQADHLIQILGWS